MRTFYDAIEPYRSFNLPVSKIHTLHIEEVGNEMGKPIIFLHGGPGGGIDSDHRRFFDPKKWRIILFDQRGSGKSTPYGSLEENTTWDLVADIEKIREELKIDAWHVFGGSWGSTLALAYAIKHPNRVKGIILRGIFLVRKQEIDWFYQFGASEIYPDAWEKFLEPIPVNERHNLLAAYHERLVQPEVDVAAAKAWSTWEGSTSKLLQNTKFIERFSDDQFAYAFARIESHYFINNCFFSRDNWILDNINKIRHIKASIIQGRYDMPCPVRSAWDLHRAWPEAEFTIVQDAGHAASEPGIIDCLVSATDAFANHE